MIKEISIYNFKCLRAVEGIRLGKVNLLTGVNGRGKSSFLQALLVLSQSWKSREYGLLVADSPTFVSLGGFGAIRNDDAPDEPVRYLILTDDETDNRFELSYKASRENPAIGELMSFNVAGHDMLSGEGEEDSEIEEEEDAAENDVSDAVPSVPNLGRVADYPSLVALKNMYYVAANRLPVSDCQDTRSTSDYGGLLPNGFNVLDAMWSLGEERRNELEHMLSEIFDGASMKLRLNGDNYDLTLDSHSNGRHMYRPVNVGYGFTYILSMLTAMLMMNENDMLVIENPEAHLHPGAQSKVIRKIIDMAVARNLQIFVETHSDHVVNGALVAVKQQRGDFGNEDLEIVFFSDYGVKNLNITAGGHVMEPPKDFCDQYVRDLDILFS